MLVFNVLIKNFSILWLIGRAKQNPIKNLVPRVIDLSFDSKNNVGKIKITQNSEV